MSFIGPVTRVDESWVRPHDMDILTEPTENATEAMIERVVYLGFEVRVELLRTDGSRVWAQVPRDDGGAAGAGAWPDRVRAAQPWTGVQRGLTTSAAVAARVAPGRATATSRGWRPAS